MDNMHFKEVKKDDRFEILAVLREAKKRQARIEFTCDDKIFSSNFHDLDLNGFQIIADLGDIQCGSTFAMVIKGSTEKIEFTSTVIAGPTELHCLTFLFPTEIVITQRRSSVRVTIPEQFGFVCEGRFRDGYVHRMVIKDLSLKGVQLLCSETLPMLTKPGMLLKNMVLNLQNYGNYPVDLTLLNLKEVTHFDTEGVRTSTFSLSCAFAKPGSSFSRRIEELLIELILEIKRLQRTR